MNLLDRVKKNDVQKRRFPFVVKENALHEEYVNSLLKELPSWDKFHKGQYTQNHRYQLEARDILPDNSISPLWRKFVQEHLTQTYWDEVRALFDLDVFYKKSFRKIGIRGIDTFATCDVLLDFHIAINTPVTKSSSVRKIHVDMPTQIIAGLYYLRLEGDDSVGGDLELYEHKGRPIFHKRQFTEDYLVKPFLRIPYQKNTFVLFPNSVHSLHGVTERMVTPHHRVFVALVADVKEPLFNPPEENRIMKHVKYRVPALYKALRS